MRHFLFIAAAIVFGIGTNAAVTICECARFHGTSVVYFVLLKRFLVGFCIFIWVFSSDISGVFKKILVGALYSRKRMVATQADVALAMS